MNLRTGVGTGNWKEEVPDRTVWRTRFGRGYETVISQTRERIHSFSLTSSYVVADLKRRKL